MRATLSLILTCAALFLASSAVAGPGPGGHGPCQAASSDFVLPNDGDTIAAGDTVHVIARTVCADPPSDIRLETSENSGLTWTLVDSFAVHGRSLQGAYIPSEGQGAIVKFRVVSATAPWTGLSIETFVG